LEAFVETYGVKYEKAADCLTKDRDALLAFYDFPAEHWKLLWLRSRERSPTLRYPCYLAAHGSIPRRPTVSGDVLSAESR
jgi:hypothetical protein